MDLKTPTNNCDPRQSEEHIERLIDEALEETFPASDPPAPAVYVKKGDGE
jgi:hypothetical protein